MFKVGKPTPDLPFVLRAETQTHRTTQTALQERQPTASRMQQQAMRSMHDPQLHTPVLRHPSIIQDQQAVVQLQQVSKDLQAAVAQLLAGQVPVTLAVQQEQMQQAFTFMQWLQKHGGLLQSLDLKLLRTLNRPALDAQHAAAVSQLADALQQAAAAGPLQLQSFVLSGPEVGAGVLQHLPAAHLTRLAAAIDVSNSASMQALAGLSGLRCLQLSSSDTAAASDDVLAPLSALQQLTLLHAGRVRPVQLQWVPASVQQLQLSVGRVNARQLQQLAEWLREHASIVSHLDLNLADMSFSNSWQAAIDSLVAAFQAAAADAEAAAAAAMPAAATARTTASSTWKLQDLKITTFLDNGTAGSIVKHLPAGTLRRLRGEFNWNTAAHISAVCAQTSLQDLYLGDAGLGGVGLIGQADDALAPLSSLQQLKRLKLYSVRREQLQHLQLPKLQHLSMHLYWSPERPPGLRLDQLTALQTLSVESKARGLQREDRLPPSLREINWRGLVTSPTAGIQPLLVLSQLQQLHITCEDILTAGHDDSTLVGEDLAQLSTLTSLQDVALKVDRHAGVTAEAVGAAAWHMLPLRQLHLRSAGVIHADVLQELGKLQGLTLLLLRTDLAGEVAATHQQMGVVLQQLTRLQDLQLQGLKVEPCQVSSGGAEAYHDVQGIEVLLQAICGLRMLDKVQVELLVRLEDTAVQQLSDMFAASLPAAVEQFLVKPDMVVMLSYGVEQGTV
jgi:hypothetical protein